MRPMRPRPWSGSIPLTGTATVSYTHLFSVCPDHGYIAGEHFTCPDCGRDAEVWTRVVGYLRPVQNFHKGKKEEYRLRKKYVIHEAEL